MGEAKFKRDLYQKIGDSDRMSLDTPGGRIHVQWDDQAHATPQAQLSFFAEFLHCTGLFQEWVASYLWCTPARMRRRNKISWAHGYWRFYLDISAMHTSRRCAAMPSVRD